MKVLILFSSSELGGAERSLSRMALASSDVEYHLGSVKGDGPWCEWIRSQGWEPLIFGKGRSHGGSGTFIAVVRMYLYLRTRPVDIIYVCGVRSSLWVRLLRFLAPRCYLVHGVRWNPNSVSSLDRFFRLVERTTSYLVDAWITNSQAAKNTLVSECKLVASKVHVVYNGVELDEYADNYLERPFEILTIANLNPRKGHSDYLQVVKGVLEHLPNARFVLIGRDDMNGEIQRLIKIKGLSDYVTYEGFQSDVKPWLHRARVFVLPSLWNEGCPSSILEAMSHGVPCVAFNLDGIPELIRDGEQGYICELRDYSSMIHSIVNILRYPKKSLLMSNSCKSHAALKFTMNTTVENHRHLLNKIWS